MGNSGYVIEYSKLKLLSSEVSETVKAFCTRSELVCLLQKGTISLWSAYWVNSALDNISGIARLDLKNFR